MAATTGMVSAILQEHSRLHAEVMLLSTPRRIWQSDTLPLISIVLATLSGVQGISTFQRSSVESGWVPLEQSLVPGRMPTRIPDSSGNMQQMPARSGTFRQDPGTPGHIHKRQAESGEAVGMRLGIRLMPGKSALKIARNLGVWQLMPGLKLDTHNSCHCKVQAP